MHVVGTAGHVDHGKSTLVRAITGIDPDRFEEEKRRGLTIDLGFAWCKLPSGREIGIVDVPGHERFIRNMLAGVGAIDAAIFVVAADEGWMPQSAEHLQILDFLDVGRGVVALTKTDLVDAETSSGIAEDIRRRLDGTALAGVPIVEVSAANGTGLDALMGALDRTLAETEQADDTGRARLFVDRSFTISGAGTVVTGTLTGGCLRVGDEVTLLPAGTPVRVRSLQTHNENVEEAAPAARVAANLVGVERGSVRRGDALVTSKWILSDRVAARIRAAVDLGHALAERGAYELHLGSAQTPCRLRFLESGRTLAPGASVIAEIFCERPLPIVPTDRFVVRDVGRWETVAGGIVLDQDPPRLRRSDARALDRLRARENLHGSGLVNRILAERGVARADELEALAGTTADELSADVIQGTATAVPFFIDQNYETELRRRTLGLVRAHHSEQQLAPGMPVAELGRALSLDPDLVGALVQRWEGDRFITREGAAVRLPGHGASLPPDQRARADRALGRLREAGTSPPRLRELGISIDLAKALERNGELVLLDPELAYARDVWSDIERSVARLISVEGPVTVAQVRDAVATSRRFAVPLLERLDELGVTRRRGDLRELGPRGRNLLASED